MRSALAGVVWFYQLLPVIFYETPEPSEGLRKKALSVLGIKNAFQQPAGTLALGVLGLGGFVLRLCWVGEWFCFEYKQILVSR